MSDNEWVMVPSVPTKKMIQAAVRREDEEPLSDWGKIVSAPHSEIYAAMIAAAPQPKDARPSPEGVGDARPITDAEREWLRAELAAGRLSIQGTPTPQEQDSRKGRCMACGRPTDEPCGGLDGNGLGCTNKPAAHVEGGARVKAQLTVCIEGIGFAKMALMAGNPGEARKRLDEISDRLDALAPPADGEGRV